MHLVGILFGAVLLNLLSGFILTIYSRYKGLVSISRLVVDTEMGRGLTAIFTGITTLCTIFTLKEFGTIHLLAFALMFELCALFSATLGLALYPIMIRSATSINSRAKRLSEDIPIFITGGSSALIFPELKRDMPNIYLKEQLVLDGVMHIVLKNRDVIGLGR